VILLDERLQVDCDHRARIEDMQSLLARLPTLNNRANWPKTETLLPPAWSTNQDQSTFEPPPPGPFSTGPVVFPNAR
jgi:hypothetical protein